MSMLDSAKDNVSGITSQIAKDIIYLKVAKKWQLVKKQTCLTPQYFVYTVSS